MREQKTSHEIHRGVKHISMVTYISAGGDHMTSFLFSQVADTFVQQLGTEGF
jgi:hypothetical protein